LATQVPADDAYCDQLAAAIVAGISLRGVQAR
jgi:hypothetical protein